MENQYCNCGVVVQVPITVAFNMDLVSVPNAAPILVYAYGAYGHNLDISHAVEYELLLEQGFVIAFAHVRGGGELGRRCACSQYQHLFSLSMGVQLIMRAECIETIHFLLSRQLD